MISANELDQGDLEQFTINTDDDEMIGKRCVVNVNRELVFLAGFQRYENSMIVPKLIGRSKLAMPSIVACDIMMDAQKQF